MVLEMEEIEVGMLRDPPRHAGSPGKIDEKNTALAAEVEPVLCRAPAGGTSTGLIAKV
jgi:hypothetical protein